jgi:predicted nucleic acid-binding protein
MHIVVDSNIIISLLIKPDGVIFDLFDQLSELHDLYISDVTLTEIFRHQKKIAHLSTLSDENFENLKTKAVQKVTVIPSSFIPDELLVESYKLVEKIDPNDFAFIATTIFVNAILWTGDKKLYNGLKSKGFHSVINTN